MTRPFRLEWVPAGTAQPNPDQYVEHPDEQLSQLRALIFGRNAPGWAGATVINERTPEKGWSQNECGHYFVDGHARDAVAQKENAEIPALIGQWTPAEEKQLIALINPLGLMARVIPEKQLALLESAIALADDPTILSALSNLAEQAEIAWQMEQQANLPPPAPEDNGPEVDPSRGAELQQKWGTALGQLWLIPSLTVTGEMHRLLCGDCTNPADFQTLTNGQAPTLMATDPPYGVEYDSSWRVETGLSGGEYAVGQILNDDRADWREVYELWRPEVLYVWHGGLHADVVKASMQEAGYQIRSQLIWAKPSLVISRGHYHWQHEPCWYGVRKGCTANWQGDRTMTTLWMVGNGSATSRSADEIDHFHAGHISQKPVELFRKPILNHTRFGEAVAEPFAGSGTAFVAAEQLGRLCYGMELDPQAVAMTLERLSLMGLTPQLV